MLLLLPPQREFPPGGRARKQTTFTSQRSSLPTWPARPAAALVALRSLQEILLPQSPLLPASRNPQPTTTDAMSSPHNVPYGSPRSLFSPTLGSIEEVFEYEPLDITSQPASPPLTPHETQDTSVGVLPEPSTTAAATLSVGQRTMGIIVSPRKGRTTLATSKVTNVLRKVLEADRVRRRRALRIYLKAIVFLKLLLKSHERYGALMATSGVHMPR
ncbi:hypothetical protein HBH56_147110 [Parastagonospora nodorum]|uniref:Uncharacterized protein n=2 Tax=Phaeosphaeria nodorum (strain SN15 / ATCC MYA-4574 / FGSC 10173) TaxID=321614 RepID=A0A7U2HW22_PHANO|nr:hypothetical protein HBH56_147110 [Parastagonospora nodorum]QRC94005.1 hypothetical protein JI435_072960 [Parastagonospora nodorum SN15]KAH3923319.1 hypothetical protein HBH54_211750 [Parastagonospora nodorum]KAH3945886.1 hypothetical protein HBH53_134570 [Parastagonospora nodorum]KAH3983969.1 hypothetical protein HBH52_065470 [Parastagonospora nodorum]